MSSLLEACAIGFERSGRTVLDAVDVQLAAGECLGIVGPNGAGKTSLLRLLAGLESADRGTVLYEGQALQSLGAELRARCLGYHPQNPELHWPLSVSDILQLGRLPHRGRLTAPDSADTAAIARAVAMTGLEPLLTRRGDTLSGGELTRVHLARLLAGEHRVLLADEPIANLDPRFQLEILGLLQAHARLGGGTMVVLHDLALAARFCDRLMLLDRGRVELVDRPASVLTPARLASVFGVGDDYHRLSGIAAALALCS